MTFASRKNKAFIELELDQEILFKLPPISEGFIQVNIFHATPGDPPHPGDIDNLRKPPRWGGVTMHKTGMQTIAIEDLDNDNNGNGTGGGGDIDPARDLQIELKHSNHPVTIHVNNGHTIIATSLWSDDLWRLKIKRVNDPFIPSSERRRYRIEAMYRCLLPEIERRIPLRFFQNGFEQNWNKENYLNFAINGNKLKLHVRNDFPSSSLREFTYDFKEWLDFENIFSERIDLGIGVGSVVINHHGDTQKAVFISLRLKIHGGDVNVRLPLDGSIRLVTIPDCNIFIRFYMVDNAPRIRFIPVADLSDLFNKLNLGDTVGDIIMEIVNEQTKKLQSMLSGFGIGEFLRPWLVGGDYELLSLGYAPGNSDVTSNGIIQPATGELVVKYVGPRQPEPPTINPNPDEEILDDGSIDLFLVPFEVNIPITARRQIGVHPISPRPGNMRWLRNIDHIIVLMQENRSFDHILGYLSREGIREYIPTNKIDQLTDNEMISNKVIGLAPEGHQDHSDQFNEFAGIKLLPKKANLAEPPRLSITGWAGSTDNPSHGIEDVSLQIDGGSMKGFVKNYAHRIGLLPTSSQIEDRIPELRNVMNYFGGEHLQIYAEIAKQFGICDRWYSSFAGGTLPNRYMTLTGRLNLDRFGQTEEANPDIKNMIPSELPTLFEYLELFGKKWRVYEHGYSFARLFGKYTFDTTNILPFNDPIQGFEAAARTGNLPEFTYIEPNYIELPPGNDDHAPADMKDGQTLIERVVRAVVNSPKWFKTLLIITYDEHGGFYDHVPPPINFPHSGGNTHTLGVRVPTLVISPLIKPGSVFHRRFDHTSIGATVLRRFCHPTQPPHLSARMDSAFDLSEVLELSDSPVPRFDFGIFGGPTIDPNDGGIDPNIPLQPPPHPPGDTNNFRSLATNDPQNDFHWILSIVRLLTGQGIGFGS